MMFNYLAGRNEPSAAFFQNIKQAFPWVNIEWLITGEGEMCRPLADGEDEKQTGPKMDIVSEKILLMLQQMPEDKRREVLKYAEEREQLAKSEKTPAKRRRKANGD